uniref:Prokineticin Bm8-e n=1 Tax=Bombina maxima TaxID=161274 RepID=BM8E_BOMMX|nr:RecName: Full=Prokineticin Bm8-e; Flags: Precursor [Bombina maxima]CAD29344.1 BM8-e protein [Bombina maxima]
MKCFAQIVVLLLVIAFSHGAVITGVCDRDAQCGSGTCCAASAFSRNIRFCVPLGNNGEECHPASHKVPYNGKRLSSLCPCNTGLTCPKSGEKFQCS